ncbi:MAG: peptidoglycan-binding protein [Alphaproteobacteria bacterium]|nr:peptidoglycan-binding protein [Alphaproteobacteria bacterium]
MFNLTGTALARLASLNSFDIRDDVVMFGLRGCLPVSEQDGAPRREVPLDVGEVDNIHPRCTLGLWWRGRDEIACFPGSTSPFKGAIEKSAAAGGAGANQMMTQLARFRVGRHPQSKPPAEQHDAFLQDAEVAYQRTADDLDYDTDDTVSVGIVGDNLHCGFCQSATQPYASSFGCQVVVGFARRAAKPGSVDAGPWKRFRDLAYAEDQDRFPYMLLSGTDARAAAVAAPDSIPARLRYGSSGELVERAQAALKQLKFLKDKPDGQFARDTLFAVIAFQRSVGFLPDGVIGRNTADALKLKNWPSR